jgi:hypothetical protein
MLPAKLYRVLPPGEERPADVIRVRVPVKEWHDFQRPKAGYRCRNAACSVAVVMIEVDSSTLPHPRTPHLMTDARCPFCGGPLVLGGYYEVVELAPVEVPRPREKKPQR